MKGMRKFLSKCGSPPLIENLKVRKIGSCLNEGRNQQRDGSIEIRLGVQEFLDVWRIRKPKTFSIFHEITPPCLSFCSGFQKSEEVAVHEFIEANGLKWYSVVFIDIKQANASAVAERFEP